MINLLVDAVNKVIGRYTIEGTYVGKDIYNIYLDTANELYEATKGDSLDDIFKQWLEEQDALHNSKTFAQLLNASNLQNYTDSYTQDAIAHTVRCKGYEYVAGKRYEEKFGRNLAGK